MKRWDKHKKTLVTFCITCEGGKTSPTMTENPKVIKERTDHFDYINTDNFHIKNASETNSEDNWQTE